LSSFVTHTLMILADAPATQPARPTGLVEYLTNPLAPMILILLVFFLFSSNSRRKETRQRQSMLDNMKRGDRIQTIGGILGTVVEVREGEVVVKVDESNNTKIKFSRSAIQRVVTEEDKAEAK